MEQLALTWGDDKRRFLTVSELTESLRALLEEEFGLLWVAGEISGTRAQTSGHVYFTLKDGEAVLNCVCYRSSVRFLKFKPKDGVAVLARGRLDIWPPSGRYQLVVEALEPQGLGALQVAFEKLKQRLTLEGLFADDRKRPLPRYPRRIGIVTSPTGAVIQDMLRIIARRWPLAHVRLFPALVQGEGSVDQVSSGIRYFSECGWPEVVIVARGGGSLEDLWTFNEEQVARSIAASKVPVVSAIGHETDVTIADFVADKRAATPSMAAELVTPDASDLDRHIAATTRRLERGMRLKLAECARKLHQSGVEREMSVLRRRIGRALQAVDDREFRLRDCVRSALARRTRRIELLTLELRRRDVRLRLSQAKRTMEGLEARIRRAAERTLVRARSRFGLLAAHLGQLSPLKILDRGYAIVQTAEGKVVKDPEDTRLGDAIRIRVARALVTANVETVEPASSPTPDDSSVLPS